MLSTKTVIAIMKFLEAMLNMVFISSDWSKLLINPDIFSNRIFAAVEKTL